MNPLAVWLVYGACLLGVLGVVAIAASLGGSRLPTPPVRPPKTLSGDYP